VVKPAFGILIGTLAGDRKSEAAPVRAGTASKQKTDTEDLNYVYDYCTQSNSFEQPAR
jgi:hypothetical protein